MHRLKFITEASRVLNASLDYQETLKTVAKLATPMLCDWCVIDMLNEENKLDRLAVSHIDPDKIKYAIELGKKYGPSPDEAFGVYNVLRTGIPEIYKEIPEELIRASARDEEHLRISLELGFRSALLVPIRSHGKNYGVLTLIYAESGRTYSDDDLLFIEELAMHSGQAIYNAKLFEETRNLNSRLDEKIKTLEDEISKRKQIEEQLKKNQEELILSEQKLKIALDASNTGVYVRYPETNKMELDENLEEMLGRKDVTYEDFIDSIHPDDRDKVLAVIEQAVKKGYEFEVIYRLQKNNDGFEPEPVYPGKWETMSDTIQTVQTRAKIPREITWILDRGRVFEYGGKPIVSGVCVNITRLKLVEAQLNEREQILAQITETIKDVFFLYDPANYRFIYVSPAFDEMWGLKREELYKDPRSLLEYVVPGDRYKVENIIRSGNIEFTELEYGIRRPDGVNKWLRTKIYPIKNGGGKDYRHAGVTEDITIQRMTAEMVKNSLFEKEILLKEIHHRVKNNLQIISSLLNLQKSFIADETVITKLNESRSRVRTMALVHEKLYQSKDFSRINFEEYISDLVSGIFQAFLTGNKDIQLETDIGEKYINANLAVNLGLIINELVTNSFKHGFKDREKGCLQIKFRIDEKGRGRLTISDDGSGLPPGFSINNSESLGMQLVNTLTEQISGEVRIKNRNGASFEIIFKMSV